jgi:hypothetical protein
MPSAVDWPNRRRFYNANLHFRDEADTIPSWVGACGKVVEVCHSLMDRRNVGPAGCLEGEDLCPAFGSQSAIAFQGLGEIKERGSEPRK